MQQASRSTINANRPENSVDTLQAIGVVDGLPITLPPEILNTILGLVKDRNSLLVCRLVNKSWKQYASSTLQSDYEITIHFKKRLKFSPHTDLKVTPWPLDQLSSLNALLTSLSPSLKFPCRNFLFQGVRIGENKPFHQFLCNYGDQILKLDFEECEIPLSYPVHVDETDEKGNSCYQAFVYWVMQKVPKLTHLYCAENIFVNKSVAKKGQAVKDIENIYFEQLSEFHFRPYDYNGLEHFQTSITNTNIIMNNIFVNQILAHCPNLKKYFARPSINKMEQLNHLVDGNNVSKLKNFALHPQSRFNCRDTMRLIEKFVHEDLPRKLALEELDIDITPLPFKSTLGQNQRDMSCTYVTLTNQLLENNKDTLKFLIVSTYDEDDLDYMEPMWGKIQFPQLMPNVDTFLLGISMDTLDATVSSWKDFYNAIFFPCKSIQRLNWKDIFPRLQKLICWNFKVHNIDMGSQGDKDKPPLSKNDQDIGAPPFDYKIPTVTWLKICQSSSETIEYFGKMCPSVNHFIFWLAVRFCQQRIIWDSGHPLIFKDVIRRALEYFPVLTKLEIELEFEVRSNVKYLSVVDFAQELRDDILAFILRNRAVDYQQGSDEPALDLKGLSSLTFTITTKFLDFTRQTFTLRDGRNKSCHVVVVVQ